MPFGGKKKLSKNILIYLVILAERKSTGALSQYYQTAASRSFEMTVDAVKYFARTDAERFRLRDALRAQALPGLIEKFSSSFVEAGMMHFRLKRLMIRQVPQPMLGQNDCRRLFARIRGANTFDARQIVADDVMGS